MLYVAWHNPKLLAIIIVAQTVCIGWIPYLIAINRKALHRHLIGLAGLAFGWLPPMFLPILFWSLLGRPEEADGPGFPMDPPNPDDRAPRPSIQPSPKSS